MLQESCAIEVASTETIGLEHPLYIELTCQISYLKLDPCMRAYAT
jgi:hypothetical protein